MHPETPPGFEPTAIGPVTAPPARRNLFSMTAQAVLVMALAAAGVMGVRHWWQQSAPSLAEPSVAGTDLVTAPLRPVVVGSADALPSRRPVTVAGQSRLNTTIHVAGHPEPVHGDALALPSGARFDVRVSPALAGRVLVYAITPSGGAPVLLWQASAHEARQPLRSPMLRLEGERGVERLRVLLLGNRGEVLGAQEIRIWHV
jgi:hypothetical protein